MATKPAYKFPKHMGACADLLYDLKNRRLAQDKVAGALLEEEKALKEHIIQNLPKSEASGIAGKVARVTVVTKEVPQLKDDDKFFAFMAKNKRWDLMQRRISDTAVREMWDSGKKVPGVEPFTVVTISLNKL